MRDFLAIQGTPKSDLTSGRYGELVRSDVARDAEGDVPYANKKFVNVCFINYEKCASVIYFIRATGLSELKKYRQTHI